MALLVVSDCDQLSGGEKIILLVASLLDYSDRLLVLLSHKAAIFGTAKLCEQSHEGDSGIGTGLRLWIA